MQGPKRLLVGIGLVLAAAAAASGPGEPAPEWSISEWLNADPGFVADQRGRIVLIQFFQMNCAASNAFSVPLFQEWQQRYGDRDDVVLVSVHSVFQDHDAQDPERLRDWVRQQGLTHPVGIDAFFEEDPPLPVTLERFEAGGTPQVVVLDREGRIRFSRFGAFERDEAQRLIDALLDGKQPDQAASAPRSPLSGTYEVYVKPTLKTCKGPRGAQITKRVAIDFDGPRVTARFPRELMGRDTVELDYDPDRGELSGRMEERIAVGTTAVEVVLDIRAWRSTESDGARFDFELTFEKVGDDPALDCRIIAEGRAERVADR